ncbi:hypothetical protein R5W24_000736 [Gemmata sp. JC717]|uniref:hypothetical protein n=1 Tax=Gemmata algarum TaxID=2975278 RepID=UPI0021BB9D35|nr:hypothetical protein [Gemmata algarum]MDY3551657.1 hypothetical protein [Gemmata algarum]
MTPHWLTRWAVWARTKLLRGGRPLLTGVTVGFERAGATRWESPVPWTADAVALDVGFRGPLRARHKSEFALRTPSATFPADTIRPGGDDRFHVTFRFPVPPDSVSADLLWRGRVVETLLVPVLAPTQFLTGLTLTDATVAVRFGGTTAPASAIGRDRYDGLVAVALLRSPTALAPLAELGLRVAFHDSRSGTEYPAVVALGAAQLARSEALVTAVCPEHPQPAGPWWVVWHAGDRSLSAQRLQVVPEEKFELGVRVLEIRFALLDASGTVHTAKQPPVLSDAGKIGPCFVLAGGEPGAVGVCRFEIVAFASAGPDPNIQHTAEAVITDGPMVFAPALFDVSALARVSGFELRLGGRVLAVASLRPVPAARINGEGGFVPPPDFTWSQAADDELADRLRRLQ